MSGELDLPTLLSSMSARLEPGSFVFVVAEPGSLAEEDVLASVREPEGRTVVTSRAAADRAGLPYDFVAGWITLAVHSALAAVGLTAAVSSALGAAGISCNVLAGYHHDHLLVPLDRTDEALAVLRAVSDHAQSSWPGPDPTK